MRVNGGVRVWLPATKSDTAGKRSTLSEETLNYSNVEERSALVHCVEEKPRAILLKSFVNIFSIELSPAAISAPHLAWHGCAELQLERATEYTFFHIFQQTSILQSTFRTSA